MLGVSADDNIGVTVEGEVVVGRRLSTPPGRAAELSRVHRPRPQGQSSRAALSGLTLSGRRHGRWCRVLAPSSGRRSGPSELFNLFVTQMYHVRMTHTTSRTGLTHKARAALSGLSGLRHGCWCRVRAPSSGRRSGPSELFNLFVTLMSHILTRNEPYALRVRVHMCTTYAQHSHMSCTWHIHMCMPRVCIACLRPLRPDLSGCPLPALLPP